MVILPTRPTLKGYTFKILLNGGRGMKLIEAELIWEGGYGKKDTRKNLVGKGLEALP
jgi:hypothetical protein